MQKAFVVLVCSALLFGCGVQDAYMVADSGSDADTDSDSDSDTDIDTDTDTDIDSDTDVDSDTDTDTDTDEDAGTDTDTDSDTDSDTEGPTVCATSDDCEEGEACSLETLTCFTPTGAGDGKFWQCWDEGLTCNSFDDGWCDYWSPPNWNAEAGIPACGSDEPPPTCPTTHPLTPACCLKDMGGSGPCLEDAFDLPD